MKKAIPIYQVDAFTNELFKGNPAAICPLTHWLPDEILQAIAAENNLAETAFFVEEEDKIILRWFTPTTEVDLCGHATLAAAHVLIEEGYKGDSIPFFSPRSGFLPVRKEEDLLVLNFPVDQIVPTAITKELAACFNIVPTAAFKGKTDYLLVFDAEEQIRNIQPDMLAISTVPARGIIITAAGNDPDTDFVSRFFAPQSGVDEDPVTGSAHTTLAPFWNVQTGKEKMRAKQLSARGGQVQVNLLHDRVELGGQAALYLKGEIYIG